MANTYTNNTPAHYLDHAGLIKLIELIKTSDNTNKLALQKVIGVKNDAGNDVALVIGTTEYPSMKAYVDKLVADLNSSVTNLDAVERSQMSEADEVTATDKVGIKVTQVDGLVTSVLVKTNDIASADDLDALEALVGTAEDTKAKATVFGAIAKEEDARKAQIGELGKVSEDEGAADHTVKSYVDAKVSEINDDAEALEDRVEALEATHDTKKDGSFKTVAEEVNEAVTALVDGAPEALDTLKEIADWIAEQGEADEDGAAQLVSKIEKNATAIAAETAAREAAIAGLNANKSSADAGKLVQVSVVEEAGVITGVTVTDIAQPCTIGDVQDLWDATEPALA